MSNPGGVLTLAAASGEINFVCASREVALQVQVCSHDGLVVAGDAANQASIAPIEMKYGHVGDEPILFFAPRANSTRTWRGRRVHTEEDMLRMDCPYPPDPDL